MNKIKFLVVVILFFSITTFIFQSCQKESINEIVQNEIGTKKYSSARNVDDIPLNMEWQDGTYLRFLNSNEAKLALERVNAVIDNSVFNEALLEENCELYPNLDIWERNQRFISMRKVYEMYECELTNHDMDPTKIKKSPVRNDAIATMISPDGLIQIGDTIQFFSDILIAKAPVSEKALLKSVVLGEVDYSKEHQNLGLFLMPRSPLGCFADFSLDINHGAKTVIANYTGSPLDDGDVSIVWTIGDGNNQHKNETNVSETYETAGEKTICVTYNKYDVVQDTTYFYSQMETDSTFQLPNGQDTTVTVYTTVQTSVVHSLKKLICTDTKCKTITIGGCTADFDTVEAIDNIWSFINKSSTPYGIIDSVKWDFGDGTTSTDYTPAPHSYPCDRKFTVTLTIFSDQCPNGNATVSEDITATSANCCDADAQMSDKFFYHPTDPNKRIEVNYDLGVWWDWAGNQDFKAHIWYSEKRRGDCWYCSKKVKWRKSSGVLSVSARGSLFGVDANDCTCIAPRVLSLQPPSIEAHSHNFKDKLGSYNIFDTKKLLRLKDGSPVYLDYFVDGVKYVTIECQEQPGFVCE